jgi:hypothetical protein
MVIGTVVEGPSDRLVLEAVIQQLCPGEHRFLPLQPKATLDEDGSGWKGVRRFCQQLWKTEGSSLVTFLSGNVGQPLDLLVIQIDADCATEADLQEGSVDPVPEVEQACPPISATVANLQQVVARWLKAEGDLPGRVILAIPAQDMENWTFAARFPGDPLCQAADYECLQHGHRHPGFCLTLPGYGKLLRYKDGAIKKPARRYEPLALEVAARWDTVRHICTQAEAFTQDLRSVQECL